MAAPQPRIGLDLSCLIPQPPTGVSYYTLNLFRALFARDRGFDYRIAAASAQPASADLESLRPYATRCRILRCPTRLKNALWTRLEWPPLEWITGAVDIAHGAFHQVPATRRARRVVTVFDLTVVTQAGAHTSESQNIHRTLLDQAVRRADRFIAISQSCKADLLRYFHVPDEKVDVVYGGVFLDEFSAPAEPEALAATQRRFGIDRDYIIHLGTLEPRKNIPRLLRAYARLRARIPDCPMLVLAGKAGWKYDDVFATCAALKLERDVVHTGYLDRADAVTLLKGAVACAYPSLYEGFGLPVLEAMAAGTPVLTSNVSSLPEVAGDAGLQVNPESEDEIEAGLASLVEDREAARARAEAGRRRAAQFTWEASADALESTYRRLL